MKKFSFPLEQVLAWRHTQTRMEEATLERANAELRAMELKLEQMARERDEAGKKLLTAHGATGIEFQSLGPFKAASEAEGTRIASQATELRRAIAIQLQRVVERKRAAKLLEKLREKQLGVWSQEAAKEVEQQAEESFLSRWPRG